MSEYYLVKQSQYTNKAGKAGILTLLVDGKGNPITTTGVGILDPKLFPVLTPVTVQVEAGTVFDGKISSRVVGVTPISEPK